MTSIPITWTSPPGIDVVLPQPVSRDDAASAHVVSPVPDGAAVEVTDTIATKRSFGRTRDVPLSTTLGLHPIAGPSTFTSIDAARQGAKAASRTLLADSTKPGGLAPALAIQSRADGQYGVSLLGTEVTVGDRRQLMTLGLDAPIGELTTLRRLDPTIVGLQSATQHVDWTGRAIEMFAQLRR